MGMQTEGFHTEYIQGVRADVGQSRKVTAVVCLGMLAVSIIATFANQPTISLAAIEVSGLAGIVSCFNHYVCCAPDDASILHRFRHAVLVHPFAVISLCVMSLQMPDHPCVHLFYFLPPVVLTREVRALSQTASIRPYHGWLATHFVAAVARSACDETIGFPPLFALAMIDTLLLDIATSKMHAARVHSDVAWRNVADFESVLSSICDAAVSLDTQWRLLRSDGLPRFAAMLGRRPEGMPGKCFADLLHVDDYGRFSDYIEEVAASELSANARISTSASITVRLTDGYTRAPISVNVIHVCHRLIDDNGAVQHRYSAGISEAWEPKKTRTRRCTSRGTSASTSPSNTGFLHPLPARDDRQEPSARQRRADSPVPAGRESSLFKAHARASSELAYSASAT